MNNTVFGFYSGMDAIEVVEQIVHQNQAIRSLSFRLYDPREKAEEKIVLSLLNRLTRNEVLDGRIRPLRIAEGFSALAVCSKVNLDERDSLHIPMMNFNYGPYCYQRIDAKYYFASVGGWLRYIKQEGVLLNSGRGFHFYGLRLLESGAWKNFIRDCQLSGLTDPRYVEHVMDNNCAFLRISPYISKSIIPKVVSIIRKESSN